MEEKSPYDPVLVNYDRAKKSMFEMNAEEFEEAAKNITRRAKEKAFSKGWLIYIGINGHVYAKYVDGRRELVEPDSKL